MSPPRWVDEHGQSLDHRDLDDGEASRAGSHAEADEDDVVVRMAVS